LGLRYEALPDDIRAIAEQKRPGGARWFAGDTSGNTEAINGQIFVQTKGNSSYKFGNTTVYAFDLSLLGNFTDGSKSVNLPKPIHQTTTDADGKFTLKVPIDRPYFIFSQANRLMVDGINTSNEGHEWRVPMSQVRAGKLLILSNDNDLPVSKVEIEKMN
jgi:flagellin-like hook-associated protein FlgL